MFSNCRDSDCSFPRVRASLGLWADGRLSSELKPRDCLRSMAVCGPPGGRGALLGIVRKQLRVSSERGGTPVSPPPCQLHPQLSRCHSTSKVGLPSILLLQCTPFCK
ncbi:hypothetical protein H1C71_041611 [Ictidomys tridecemlineatus]|nr:hypothetical protein H1C71_041611 [Ictidomys tridecemlineatus]